MFVCECCKEEIETTKFPVSKLCISCFFKRPYTNNYKKRVWKLCRELEDFEYQYSSFDIHNNKLLDMKHFVDSLIEEFESCNKLYDKLIDKYDNRYDADGSIDDKLGECGVILERNLEIKL
jgi:hypothetical protein